MVQSQPRKLRGKLVVRVLACAVGLFGLIQLIPYGRDHANQASGLAFKWNSPQAEGLAKLACYDCHSNETRWWWAVKIAPFSWLAQHDIDDAKRRLNFSEWNKPTSAQRFRRSLSRGMPPIQFTLFHSDARLTAAQKQILADGFEASLPANQKAENPTASPATPLTDAVAIINARCTGCHASTPALKFRGVTPDQAKSLIAKMVQKGASVSPSEERILITRFTS
jgi:hypothetical protein